MLTVLTHSFPTRRSSDLECPPIFSAKLRNFCSLRPQSTTDAPEAARLDEINAPIRPAAPSIQTSVIINHPFQKIHRRRRLFMPARQGAVNEYHNIIITSFVRSEEHTSELQSLMRISY